MKYLIPALLFIAACGDAPVQTPDAPAPTEEAAPATDVASVAAAIAKEVRANPGEAEAILAKHDLTTDQFEAMLFEVAASPELSEKYLAGL